MPVANVPFLLFRDPRGPLILFCVLSEVVCVSLTLSFNEDKTDENMLAEDCAAYPRTIRWEGDRGVERQDRSCWRGGAGLCAWHQGTGCLDELASTKQHPQYQVEVSAL